VALAPVDWSVNDLEGKLRALARPVIGRIEEDRLLLDMRTVADDEIAPLARCLLDLFLGEAA